jgi:hypothetical protein
VLQYVDSINLLYNGINSVSADIAVQANKQFAAAVNVATVKCSSLQFAAAVNVAAVKCSSPQQIFSSFLFVSVCHYTY